MMLGLNICLIPNAVSEALAATGCPTDFLVAPSSTTLEAEESTALLASDLQPEGFGTGTYTWSTQSSRLSLESDQASGPQAMSSITVRADTDPSPPSGPGELVEVTRVQPGCATITKQVHILVRKCKLYRLERPRIIAVATDSYLSPSTFFVDESLSVNHALGFGQDITFSRGRAQPYGVSVGSTTADLEDTMRELLDEFASNDADNKAQRLFDAFLTPRSSVTFWEDHDLTAAAEAHPNIVSFVSRALSAPNSPQRTSGKTRIHQALEQAGWDINRAVAPTDLGVPAFNTGSPTWASGDFDNGLGVMINGIQHALVIAKDYHYDQCRRSYYIKLEYVFYDVFGLDDDDLNEFGANGGFDSDASQGITAWWQLQHQHGYVPLITRIRFERAFTVPVP